jgi:hypothetical protein
MKRNVMFLSLFIAAFLFSSLGSVRTVKATTAEIDVCKASVTWNNKRDRVKNIHRRKYLGCLAEKLTMSSSPLELLDDATKTPNNSVGCFPLAFIAHSATAGRGQEITLGIIKELTSNFNIASFADWGTLPRDSQRRWTIQCLQIQLAALNMFPEEAECRSQVNWNNRLNQVKNGDRRTYMGCLAEKLTNTTMPADVIRQATQAKSNGMEGCFVHSYTEMCIRTDECNNCMKSCSKVITEGHMPADHMHLTSNWGDVPPDSERRNTIACLEDALR